MSALPVTPTSERAAPARPRLGLVPTPHRTMGRIPFVSVLAALLVAGLVGLLVLNTHLQNQAIAANDLRNEAAAMSYREGELRQQVIEESSTGELTRKASKLGLRPNDHIAFVDLRTGEITGDAAPAEGEARPESVVLTPEEEAQTRESKAEEYAQTRRGEAEEAARLARERAEQHRGPAQPQVPGQPQAPAQPGVPGQPQVPTQPETQQNPAFPGAPAPVAPPQQPESDQQVYEQARGGQ